MKRAPHVFRCHIEPVSHHHHRVIQRAFRFVEKNGKEDAETKRARTMERGHLRLEPRAKGVRDEPRGLIEDRRHDGVVDAQRDRERTFSGEKFWMHVRLRACQRPCVRVGTRRLSDALTDAPRRDAPGRGNTSTEAIHVAATAAAYNYTVSQDDTRGRGTRPRVMRALVVETKAYTYLEHHHRRIGHLHKRKRSWREESLHDERCFEGDVDQEHDRPGGMCQYVSMKCICSWHRGAELTRDCETLPIVEVNGSSERERWV